MSVSDGRRCRRSRAWHREQWRQHVVAQAESGFSAAAYCREHGLGVNGFYRWRQLFASEEESNGLDFGAAETGRASGPRFAELRLTGDVQLPGGHESGVELVLSGDWRLRLSPGFDVETLQRAVAALESLPC